MGKIAFSEFFEVPMSWHTECLTWMTLPGLHDEMEIKRQLKIWVPEYSGYVSHGDQSVMPSHI